MNTPFGQHLAYAMPSHVWGECFVNTPPGVPLEQMAPTPGMSVPRDGYLVPSDAPGFGMEIKKEWLEPA
jgi:L-rhamnonate dehydratase